MRIYFNLVLMLKVRSYCKEEVLIRYTKLSRIKTENKRRNKTILLMMYDMSMTSF